MVVQPNFIGIGAQKSGTSWIYACLFEHPEVCLPRKEFHFFSKDEFWGKGKGWYESQFEMCHEKLSAGEFSTTYLHTSVTAQRISACYPDVKLIVSLRNPIDRAFSNYKNDIMSGVVSSDDSFVSALEKHPEYVEKGKYAKQLRSFLTHFSSENILILIYEDCLIDPNNFIKKIYDFINVDTSFQPAMIDKKVNVGRVPRSVIFEKLLIKSSELCQKSFLRGIWWTVKKIGLGDLIRNVSSRPRAQKILGPTSQEREKLLSFFGEDIFELEDLIGRSLEDWRRVS